MIMPLKFQFVAVTDTTAPASAEVRKATHSHAITEVHAKRRRKMVDEHQKRLQVRTQDKVDMSSNISLCKTFEENRLPCPSHPLSDRDTYLLSYCM